MTKKSPPSLESGSPTPAITIPPGFTQWETDFSIVDYVGIRLLTVLVILVAIVEIALLKNGHGWVVAVTLLPTACVLLLATVVRCVKKWRERRHAHQQRSPDAVCPYDQFLLGRLSTREGGGVKILPIERGGCAGGLQNGKVLALNHTIPTTHRTQRV